MDRRVEVGLFLDISNFQRNAGIVSGTAVGIATSLKGTSAGFDRVGVSAGGAEPGLNRFDAGVRRADGSINQLTGRIRLFLDAAAMVGPGLLPIAAVGVPALTGLAAAATAGVVAGGSLILAMQGVGDAIKAVDAAKLDPTVANLEKADKALEQIGPHAQMFVAAWQDFQPVARELRDSAAAGWFPGVVESLENIERLAPRAQDLLEAVGRAGGEALEDSTASLTTDRWEEFLDFLGQELPAVVTQANGILGDLAHGAAEMWMSFDPGNDAFLDWLEGVADGFDRWASSDEGREDIRAFLDYVAENGPEVQDFAAAIVDMFVQIAQAAGPLGGPVLTILTKMAEVVAAIADSDLGTPFFAAVAGLTALNRVMLITQRLTGAQATGAAAASGGLFGGIRTGSEQARTGVKGLRADFNTLIDPMNKFGRNADNIASASERMRGRLAATGKATAGIAALTLATSDLGDSMSLTNTASMALMGTMILPGWGTAIGATAGLMLDLTAVNDDLIASLERGQAVLQSGALGGMAGELAAINKEIDELNGSSKGAWLSAIPVAGTYLRGAWDWVQGNEAEEGEKQLAALEARYESTQGAARALADAMNIDIAGTPSQQLQQLQQVMDAAALTMEGLGISWEEMATAFAVKEGGGSLFDQIKAGLDPEHYGFDEMLNRVIEAAHEVSPAVGAMAEEIAAKFPQATDAVDEFTQSIEAANDALAGRASLRDYQDSLDALQQSLKDNGKTLDINTEKGRANEAALDAIAGTALRVAEGMGKFEGKQFLAAARRDFVQAAMDLGKTRKAAQALADELGLVKSPKLDIDDKDFKTKAKSAEDKLRALDRQKAFPTVSVKDKASDKLRQVKSLLDQLQSKEITVTTRMALLHQPAGGYTSSTNSDPRTTPRPSSPSGVAGRVAAFAAATAPPSMLDATYASTRSIPQTRATAGTAYSTIPDMVAEVETVFVALGDALKQQLAALEKEAEARKSVIEGLRSEADSLEQTVAERFKSQLFGLDQEKEAPPTGLSRDQLADWMLIQQMKESGMPGPNDILQGDIAQMQQFKDLLRRLKKMGLSGSAYAEAAGSGSIEELLALLGLGKQGLRDYERLFNKRDRMGDKLGGFASDAAFGKSLDRLGNKLDGVQREINHMRREQRQHTDEVVDAAGTEGPRKFAAAVKGAVVSGHTMRGPR